ncbi:hypothetical protein BKA67DRAFT_326129 [Truncatella angustata]|uniref:Uncharacterized protein n=1 Tax=Truncatella angustata TaxID=152316 RepID=A0A9P8UJX5_9PEZI|nr:uncharacterized protein BKA67DRAFT_326129 [Truncatella angustata]KAH6653605.1 hypothetical protein BKA67DRAFT_326129 [Truncatella angustata]
MCQGQHCRHRSGLEHYDENRCQSGIDSVYCRLRIPKLPDLAIPYKLLHVGRLQFHPFVVFVLAIQGIRCAVAKQKRGLEITKQISRINHYFLLGSCTGNNIQRFDLQAVDGSTRSAISAIVGSAMALESQPSIRAPWSCLDKRKELPFRKTQICCTWTC